MVSSVITTPEVEIENEPVKSGGCACHHEKMTDGYHHYLDLPSTDVESFNPESPLKLNAEETYEDTLPAGSQYIAVALAYAKQCWREATKSLFFSGPSETGPLIEQEISLCSWCEKHWSVVATKRPL